MMLQKLVLKSTHWLRGYIQCRRYRSTTHLFSFRLIDFYPQLYQDYAIPFDLPILKLICLHVAEHRDEVMLRQVWNQIFDQGQ